MTWMSRLLAIFPLLPLSIASGAALWFVLAPNPWAPLLGFAGLYLVPLIAFRLHNWLWPLREGFVKELVGGPYCSWWGGHQIQLIYIAFPALEVALRLIPGLFSLWLRLWGAQVGRGVYWTPFLEVTDRSLLEVGDGAVFGHRVGLYAHAIKPRDGNLVLFVRRLRIGAGAFVGAAARLGPGVRVEPGAFIETATDLYPNARVPCAEP